MSTWQGSNRISGLMIVSVLTLAACSDDGSTRTTQTVALAQPVATAEVMAKPDTSPVVSKPTISNVSYQDAESVYRKGHYADALELFAVYTAEHPESGQGHYMLGLSAWKTGDHERAEAALKARGRARWRESEGAHESEPCVARAGACSGSAAPRREGGRAGARVSRGVACARQREGRVASQ